MFAKAFFEFGAEAGGFGRDCHGFVACVEVGEDFWFYLRDGCDAGGEEDGEGEEGGDELFHGVVMVACGDGDRKKKTAEKITTYQAHRRLMRGRCLGYLRLVYQTHLPDLFLPVHLRGRIGC